MTMAAKKRAAKTSGDKFNKSAFIREYPSLSVKELQDKAMSDHGVDLKAGIIYAIRSKDKHAGNAAPTKRARKESTPSFSFDKSVSLIELLSDPNEVQAAKAAIEAEIKELEAKIASRKTTLKILNAAG
jgi:hypothetical protein